MAAVTIPNLPVALGLNGTEQFEAVQAGMSTRVTSLQVATYAANGRPQLQLFRAAAVPSTGTWSTGDIVFSTAPAHIGFIGWVCTAGGTPGTWYTWGVIS